MQQGRADPETMFSNMESFRSPPKPKGRPPGPRAQPQVMAVSLSISAQAALRSSVCSCRVPAAQPRFCPCWLLVDGPRAAAASEAGLSKAVWL